MYLILLGGQWQQAAVNLDSNTEETIHILVIKTPQKHNITLLIDDVTVSTR